MEDLKPESEVLVFIPEGEENTRQRIFDLYFRLLAISLGWFLFLVIAQANDYHFKNRLSSLIFFLVTVLLTCPFIKYPTKLSIDSKRKLFVVTYFNFLAKEKAMAVKIPKADIIYKSTVSLASWGSYWELLVYDNYFTNRIRIQEKTEGFSKAQLEAASKALKEVQSGVK